MVLGGSPPSVSYQLDGPLRKLWLWVELSKGSFLFALTSNPEEVAAVATPDGMRLGPRDWARTGRSKMRVGLVSAC